MAVVHGDNYWLEKIATLTSGGLAPGNGSVTTAKLADGAVTTPKLADGAVTTIKLGNLAVTGAKIADGTINESKLDTATAAKLNRAILNAQRVNPSLSTDFLVATGNNAVDPFIGVAIATGTSNLPNLNNANHPGLARILSSTTTNSGYYIGTNSGQILLAGGEFFDTIFELDVLAGSTTRLGFHNSATSADAVDGCYIEIDTNGIATGKTANNSTRSTTGTTFQLVVSTFYRATVELNTAGTSVTFTIYNDAGTVVWTDTLTANIPTTRVTGAAFNVTNSGTTAIALSHIDFLGVLWKRSLVRGGA